MKSSITIKQILLAFTIVLSIAACKKDKTGETTPVEVKSLTITELKALSTSASVKVPDNRKIKGIVVSDIGAKNIDSKTVILQEATDKPGIIVTFDAAPTFALNDEVEVTVSNQTLAQVNGEVVLQNIPVANAKKTGTGTITAKAATVTEIAANKAALNGTLVTIAATELTGGSGKYTGTLTIKDASGTITANVLAGAVFENTAYPVSVSGITGIVRVNGNDVRMDIRKADDVVTGSVSRIETLNLSQDFGLNDNYITRPSAAPAFDATFTDPSKAYIYLMDGERTGDYNVLFTNDGVVKEGLKTISVTFAGSNVRDSIPSSLLSTVFPDFTGSQFYLSAFDASKDYFQIELVAYQYNYALPLKFQKFIKRQENSLK